jgi:hypothetical protein
MGGIQIVVSESCRRPIEAELGGWFTEASGGEDEGYYIGGYVGGIGLRELLTAYLSDDTGVSGTSRVSKGCNNRESLRTLSGVVVDAGIT